MTAQPILPPIERVDGIRIQVTDQEGDDFLRRQTAIRASSPNGAAVTWRLPSRLLLHEAICAIVAEEIVDELRETLELGRCRQREAR